MVILLFLLGKQGLNGVKYYINKKTKSRFVTKMSENPIVPIFMRFKNVKIFPENSKIKPLWIVPEIMYFSYNLMSI